MDRTAQLDAIIAHFDLNAHPFYQDWRTGSLPVEKLRDYAAEYALFVGTIDEGWETLGQAHYAEEERVHERLWADFQLAVGAGAAKGRPATETLVSAARTGFGSKPEAIGSLYAFEAQQPSTSQSKLDGLREHYAAGESGEEYFRVHAGDVAERDLLRKLSADLTAAEFARAKNACALTCAAMWGALDGIYYAEA